MPCPIRGPSCASPAFGVTNRMGLDLLVFGDDPEDEIDGFRVGVSSDFDHFRRVVLEKLQPRGGRARFPMLMRDRVSDASWTTNEAGILEQELNMIASEFSRLAHEPQRGVWSRYADQARDSTPSSLLESFVTIDGELFVLAFIRFTQIAQQHNGYLRTD